MEKEELDNFEDATKSAEEIANVIKEINVAVEKLSNCGLTQRALILLIYDSAKDVSKTQIKSVLDALPKLKNYLTDT